MISGGGSNFSKLDRFMVSEGFLMHYPHLMGLVLDKNILDHRSIVLLEKCVDYGPTPFLLFHSWFKLNGFDDVGG